MKKWLRFIAIGSLAGLILFVGTAFTRLQGAKFQINQDREAVSSAAPLELGETGTLEILPLYEKAGQDELESGHGVSYLIRTEDATILFDVGNNTTASSPSPLEKNMDSLGISMDEIDMIVLSHRHPDHVGGQNWWTEKTFSIDGMTQPALGNISVFVPEVMTYPGSEPILAGKPTVLANGIATTGLITYAQPFPIWLALPKGDEQALAVNVTGKGIILITGCGHMGLDSLLARAEAAFDVPVAGVIGGLHYGNAEFVSLQHEVELVKGLNPVVVALSPHDSSATVLAGFAQELQDTYTYIKVGQPILISSTNAAP
jgi:7,8-dihydropterin-6-yl-methyl-4-(beta-D-ribofuranosyl)aminobenzene 5'-phosphate synthase